MGGSIADAIGAIANPFGYITGQLPVTLAASSKRREELGAGIQKGIKKIAGIEDPVPLPDPGPAPTETDQSVLDASRNQRRAKKGKASTYLSSPSAGLTPLGGLFSSSLSGS